MTATLHCPDCGSPLPADAPQGECPRCLLKAGFESEPPAMPSVAATRTSAGHSHFVPPSVGELQQRIPQYEILELIGQGGMGAVYKAKQAGLGRSVAIKILPFEVSQSAAFTERFSREARALALLSHPHIVAVHDFGQADGLCYFVMEFVDGVNLRQALQAGKMNPQQALAIVPQICEALQFAHEEGVVHRDIKPENILIDKRGRVKIADFGLAKLLGTDAGPEHSLTGTQQVMGTLRYMAPEQMFGSKEVDHRADIFSLGVVFYELLTGELPIGRFALPSKKSGVDARLDEVVLRALESEPNERYQSVSEMKHGLDSISKIDLPVTPPVRPAAAGTPLSGLELLLDETDKQIRICQHSLFVAGAISACLATTAFISGPFPAGIVLVTAAGCLFALAYMYRQHWEVNVGGHRVVFENGVFTGSRLAINGEVVARSGAGFRQEMQGWLPDGSGRRIIATSDAGFVHFRCRLFLQPAVPGVVAPPAAIHPPAGFAGSAAHRTVAIVVSVLAAWFTVYVSGPVLSHINGPSGELLALGRAWRLGSRPGPVFVALIGMFCGLIAAVGYAWWTYRTALIARNPRIPREVTTDIGPRLSRAAIWGLVLSPLFVLGVCLLVVATIPAVVVQRGDDHSTPQSPIMWWMMIPFAIVELACLIAPVATTILGIIAIGNIRGSKGKVHGMPLAVFDALLYPLLLLDLILFVVGLFVISVVISGLFWLMKDDGTVIRVAWVGAFALTAIVFGPLIIWFDIWLIRLTWRAATNGLAAESDDKKLPGLPQKEPPPFQPESARGTSTTTIVILVLLGLLTIPLLLVCGLAGSWLSHDIAPRMTPTKQADQLYERALSPEQFPDPIRENTEPAKAP